MTQGVGDWDTELGYALAIGLTPEQFDDLTPRQLRLMIRAHNKREAREIEARKLLAYNTASCTISILGAALAGKTPPSCEELFGGSGEPMDDEQIMQTILSLNAALGGDDTTQGGDPVWPPS